MFKECNFTDHRQLKMDKLVKENISLRVDVRNLKSRVTDLETQLSLISKHLGVEFEWVDCEPHYEMKKKSL
jgi:dynactin complex subunit